MKALIQRVKKASVTIEGSLYSEIAEGLLVFLGVEVGDSEVNAEGLASKISRLRIFEDENGKMSKSLIDINGEILVVSQFTLCGNCKKGNRPSFDNAANPIQANDLYEFFVKQVKQYVPKCKTGKFQSMMDVSLVNNGPVTFMIEK